MINLYLYSEQGEMSTLNCLRTQEDEFKKSKLLAECFREILNKSKTLNIIHEFSKIVKWKNCEKRIEFIDKIVPHDALPFIETIKTNKNEEKATFFKQNGNEAFKKCDYVKSVECYTKSIMAMPQDKGTENVSVVIANRSAAFYHLRKYQSALEDIKVALTLNYPRKLKYKILERKAKCMLNLGQHKNAKMEFENTIQALEDALELSVEKKVKIKKDIQILLKENDKSSKKTTITPERKSKEEEGPEQEQEARLISPPNKVYLSACDRIEIREDPLVGRYAVAIDDIAAGDTILIERPYCSVLLPEFSSTNCQHCFKRSLNLYSCKTCSDVVFCSLKCLQSAKYHVYECSLLKTLNGLGVSVSVLMALRLCTQHNLQYFKNMKNKLKVKKSESPQKFKQYKSSNYVMVYNLVHHEHRRSVEDIFERTILALHLLRCLKKVDYFKVNSTNIEKDIIGENELSEDEKFMGALLLRHLQILQFNAHEISELKISFGSLKTAKSKFIGGGLFPTLALFNHSCDPGVIRYFDGTKIIVRALKPLKAGETIAENYGPIYSLMDKNQRQQYLNVHYMFDCACVPCQENWPTLKELNLNGAIMRFKCRPDKNNNHNNNKKNNFDTCDNVLEIPTNNTAFKVKCCKCGKFTNLFPGLKAVKDTTELSWKGTEYLEAGNYGEALKIFLKIYKTLYDYMAPPFGDFLLIENYIRTSMLAYGNKYFE